MPFESIAPDSSMHGQRDSLIMGKDSSIGLYWQLPMSGRDTALIGLTSDAVLTDLSTLIILW